MMAMEPSVTGDTRCLMALLVFLLVILAFAFVIIVYLTLEHRRLREGLDIYAGLYRESMGTANEYRDTMWEMAHAYDELRATHERLLEAYETAYLILAGNDLLPDDTDDVMACVEGDDGAC